MSETTHNQAEPFRWLVRVYYEDTDSGGMVYHTSYLRFMERARTEWLRSLGYSQEALRQELGALFAVRTLQIDYAKPAYLDDELAIETRVSRYRRAGLRFEQTIAQINAADAIVCRATVDVVCVDADSRRPRPIPRAIDTEIAHVC